MKIPKIENSGFIGVIVLVILSFSYFVLGFSGMMAVLGLILLIMLPLYLILNKLNLEQDEKIIFSFFAGIGIFSSITYWLARLISFRISILITFIVLTVIGVLINLENKPNKKRKNILKNILLLMGTIIVFLILLEGIARLFNLSSDYGAEKGMYRKDDLLDYSLTPNFTGRFTKSEFSIEVSTNSLGLRDVQYSDKKQNDYRILALGDSFTWGAYGTELSQTFIKLLEKKLNEKPDGLNYQVINAGAPGYGTDQEFLYLEKKSYQLKPDLVLLNFFVGNDFHDNIQSGEFTVKDGVLVAKKIKVSAPGKIRNFLLKYSYAYRLMEKGAIVLFKDFIQNHIKNKIENENYEAQLFSKPANDVMNEEFANTEKILGKLISYVKLNNMKLAIVIIPLNYQVDENQRQIFVRSNFKENQQYDMQQPQNAVKDWAKQNNVFVIDLLPGLSKINNNGGLYWKLNAHFNAKGNEEVSNIIYNELINNKNLIMKNK